VTHRTGEVVVVDAIAWPMGDSERMFQQISNLQTEILVESLIKIYFCVVYF
jgi:hypothetical protein